MSAPLRVLLTGAGGCVGRAVLAAAAREPGRWELVCVDRSGALADAPGVRTIRASLEDLPARLDQAGPLDACIHAAAAVHNQVRQADRIFAVNRDQTLALADALAARPGFRRFVFISTLAVLEEAGRPRQTPYAASKRQAEEALAERETRGAISAAVLRLATVYGPGDRGNIGSLHRAIAKRRYVRIAPAETPKTLVSSRRAAAAALLAVTADASAAAPWTVADPKPYPLAEIEDALAQAAGVSAPPRIPAAIGWTMAAAGSAFARLRLPAPLTLGRLRTMARPVAFSPVPETGPVADALRAADTRALADAFRDAYANGSTDTNRARARAE